MTGSATRKGNRLARAIAPALALVLLAPQIASAEGPSPGRGEPDLRVKHIPAGDVSTLRMRAALAADDEGGGDAEVTASADDGEDVGGKRQSFSGRGYTAIPTSRRDIQERVLFKVNVGYGLDQGNVNGLRGKYGFAPGDVRDPEGKAFADQRNLLLGDAILGTNGVLLPSLNTYFLSHYLLDFGGPTEFSALQNVYDSNDSQTIVVNAAYAEMDGIGSKKGALGNIFVRAGRQYRYGSTRFVTNFDGLSAAYDAGGWEVSGFFGQRVSLYFDDNPGLLGGGSIKLRGQELFKFPLDLAVDYLFFDGGGDAAVIEEANDLEPGDVNLARQYIELSSRVVFGSTYLYVRGRVVDNGDLNDQGFGLGRIGVQVRQPVGRKFLIVGEADQIFGREVAYDYISPVGLDVVNANELVGIGLDTPEDATLVGLRANYILSNAIEVYGFGRVQLVANASTSGFNQPYQEAGAAVSARVMRPLVVSGQYKLRLTQLDDDANLEGEEFANFGGSGVTNFQELAAETRYRAGGGRSWSAAVGAYFRVYSLQSPYAEVTDDARLGGRVDFDYWLSQNLRVKAAGELAQPSPTFAPELDTLFSVRALMEATF